MHAPPNRREILIAAIGLWIVLAIVHGPLAWGGARAAGGDLVNQLLPMTISWLRHGPGWAPGTFAGHPLFADPQSGILYPPNWLYLAFGETRAAGVMTFLLVAHLWWAGLGTFIFARRWMGAAGAALAACAWMCGGAFGAKLAAGITVFVFAGAHLPWIMHAAHGLMAAETRCRAIACLVLLSAFQILAGAPQIVQMTWVGTALWLAVANARADGRWTPIAALKAPALLFAAFLGGVAIALPQLAASAEYSALAYPRDGGDRWNFITGDSLQLRQIVHWILPDFYGAGNSIDFWGSTSGFFDANSWIGMPALMLVGWALVDIRRGARMEIPALVVGIFALILAFGKSSPLFRLFFEIVPTFDMFRVPARWIAWTGFAMTMLAGAALDRVLNDPQPRRAIAQRLAPAAALAVFFIAAGMLLPRVLQSVFGVGEALAMRDPALASETLKSFTETAAGALHWGIAMVLGSAAIIAGACAKKIDPRAALALLALIFLADAKRFWTPYQAAYPTDLPPEQIESVERFPRVNEPAEFERTFYPKDSALAKIVNEQGGRFIFTDDAQGWMSDQNNREILMEMPSAIGLEGTRGYQQLVLRSYVEELETTVGAFEPGMRVGPFMLVPLIADRAALDAYNVKTVFTYFGEQPPQDFARLGFARPVQVHPAGLHALANPHARGWAWLAAGTDWLKAAPDPELGSIEVISRRADREEFRVTITGDGGAWLHASSPLHPGWAWENVPQNAVAETGRSIRLAKGTYTLARSFTVKQLSAKWLVPAVIAALIALFAALWPQKRTISHAP